MPRNFPVSVRRRGLALRTHMRGNDGMRFFWCLRAEPARDSCRAFDATWLFKPYQSPRSQGDAGKCPESGESPAAHWSENNSAGRSFTVTSPQIGLVWTPSASEQDHSDSLDEPVRVLGFGASTPVERQSPATSIWSR